MKIDIRLTWCSTRTQLIAAPVSLSDRERGQGRFFCWTSLEIFNPGPFLRSGDVSV